MMVGIDATNIFCPDFTVPVMSLIKKHVKPGQQGVIKTKEARSVKRLAHLCASNGWVLEKQQTVKDLYFFQILVPISAS